MPIGAKVTLRRERMYEFLDRLVNIAIPRIRDFRGLNRKSFDGRGNFSMGVKEQIMFPEIDFDKIDAIRGMDITITTTAKTDGHFAPNPYPANSVEQAQFSKKIYELYVKDSEESKAQLKSILEVSSCQ